MYSFTHPHTHARTHTHTHTHPHTPTHPHPPTHAHTHTHLLKDEFEVETGGLYLLLLQLVNTV